MRLTMLRQDSVLKPLVRRSLSGIGTFRALTTERGVNEGGEVNWGGTPQNPGPGSRLAMIRLRMVWSSVTLISRSWGRGHGVGAVSPPSRDIIGNQ